MLPSMLRATVFAAREVTIARPIALAATSARHDVRSFTAPRVNCRMFGLGLSHPVSLLRPPPALLECADGHFANKLERKLIYPRWRHAIRTHLRSCWL